MQEDSTVICQDIGCTDLKEKKETKALGSLEPGVADTEDILN